MTLFSIEMGLLIDETLGFSVLGMPKTLKPFIIGFFNEKTSFSIEISLLIDVTLGFSVLGMPKTKFLIYQKKMMSFQ